MQYQILTALAFDLDEDWQVGWLLPIPCLERLEELESITFRVNGDGDGSAILWRALVSVLAGIISTRRQLIARRIRKLERFAVSADECVGHRVEGKVASKSHGSDDIR